LRQQADRIGNFDYLSVKLSISLVAVGLTVSALFLAYCVGGPTVRALLGPPAAFHEPSTDFTSSEMYAQAFLSQSVCIAAAFLCLGAILGRRLGKPWPFAVWAANPLTVGGAYIIFIQLYKTLHLPVRDYEYYGVRNGGFLTLVSLIVFAPLFCAGAYFVKVWSRNRS
jgi:hypothetical protein